MIVMGTYSTLGALYEWAFHNKRYTSITELEFHISKLNMLANPRHSSNSQEMHTLSSLEKRCNELLSELKTQCNGNQSMYKCLLARYNSAMSNLKEKKNRR